MPNSPSCVSRSRRAPELPIPHVARAPGLFQRTRPPLVCPRRVRQRPLPFSSRILLFQWRSVTAALPSQPCAHVSADPVFLCVPLHLSFMSRDAVSRPCPLVSCHILTSLTLQLKPIRGPFTMPRNRGCAVNIITRAPSASEPQARQNC